jgi:hypothetical protein
MRRICQLAIGILSVALLTPDMATGGELTDAEFRRLHKLLRPAPDEAWRTIPWKIAMLDAQRNAVAEKKPIFIWAMDGHPLGCT